MLSSTSGRNIERHGRDVNNNVSKNDEVDYDENLVKLSLNKPRRWGWQLTTSSSSPHIAFPKIQLFDSKTDKLLIETDQTDCVYQGNKRLERQWIHGEEIPIHVRSHSNNESSNNDSFPLTRSKSTSSKNALIAESEAIIESLREQLNKQGIDYSIRSRSVSRARSIARDFDTIHEDAELKRNEPDDNSPQVKDVKINFLQPPALSVPVGGGCLKKSKSATEVQKTLRPYCRSTSSVRFTSSFLQRMSERKEDESSCDSELENRDRRYFYRSSKAGTLLICQSDNPTNRSRRRRRSRNLDLVVEHNNEVKDEKYEKNGSGAAQSKAGNFNQLGAINKSNELLQRNPILRNDSSNNTNYQCLQPKTSIMPVLSNVRLESLPPDFSTICHRFNQRRSASVGNRIHENHLIPSNSSSDDEQYNGDNNDHRFTSKRIRTPRRRQPIPTYPKSIQNRGSKNSGSNDYNNNNISKEDKINGKPFIKLFYSISFLLPS